MIINHARPIEDTEIVAWSPSSGVTLYDKINEEAHDDAGFVNTTAEANHSTFRLSALPRAFDGSVVIRFRARSTADGYLTVQLLDGSTLIAERLFGPLDAGYSMLRMDLTAPEVAVISDYANLHVRFYGEYAVYRLLLEDGVSRLELEAGNGPGDLLIERNA
jgi:hypothetical protein